MSHRQNESPEERKKAEALAIEEAKKVAAKNTAIPTPGLAPSTPVTHSKPAKPAAPNTLKGGIPNGVFLGFWALIAHVLQEAGREVAMGGNIGVPILDLPPPSDDCVHWSGRMFVVSDRPRAVAGARASAC